MIGIFGKPAHERRAEKLTLRRKMVGDLLTRRMSHRSIGAKEFAELFHQDWGITKLTAQAHIYKLRKGLAVTPPYCSGRISRYIVTPEARNREIERQMSHPIYSLADTQKLRDMFNALRNYQNTWSRVQKLRAGPEYSI